MKKIFLLLVIASVLSGCAPKTTVILLPEEDGSTGSLIVMAEDGAVEMNTAYTSSIVGTSTPTAPEKIDKELVEKKFSRVIAAQPEQPESYFLRFTLGTSQLTKESKELVPDIIKSVENRKFPSVSIIGHSDTAGNEKYNIKLSEKRAQVVKKILLNSGLTIKTLFVESYGESDLLFPTADGVADSRNRRVEIMVR